MAMGSYEGKQALAVGGFYRPDKRTMLSIGASTTSSKHMMNMGISIALDRLPEAERKAKEAAKAAGVEQETLNRVLERLAALEQDNRRLQADNEKRDAFAAQYSVLSRLWEALSPDSVIVPHTNDYSWLTKVYESVKPPVGTASCFGMPWEQKLLSWCIRTSISKRLLTILKLW